MFNKQKEKLNKKQRRHARVRSQIFGTAQRPRLSVSRSLKHIYLQLIDDQTGQTLISAHDQELQTSGNKIELAAATGKLLAEKALQKKITTCIFDKSAYQYHGRVKAAATGARAGGLKF